MAASQAAYRLEKAVGHDDNAVIKQDVTSFDPGNETMKALVWQGKNKVEVGMPIPVCPASPGANLIFYQ